MEIRKKVFKWYGKNKRFFPWRNTKNPYHILIAEFMLHRTRAAQVSPIYSEFIKKYPTIQSLSSARYSSIEKVTRHLGLHWRSKHFIESAKYILQFYSGDIPSKRDELLKIPGVGDYIAGAILTVCFNKKEYVVDSNIARFINRFYNLKLNGEIRRKKEIIEYSKKLFQARNSGRLLFAIIDFTSLVCKPIRPQCGECILSDLCGYSYKKAA